MNNDLISRSALLEAFANSEHIKETTDGLDVMETLAIKEVIDNAPTVEYPFYQEAYQTGYEEGKNERPQSDIHDFISKADESTLFQLKKEIENALKKIIEQDAYDEARREAMRLDDNEDTYKWRGHA